MGRKKDLAQVDAIAKKYGLTPEERREFGKYLEDCKAEFEGGSANLNRDFTWQQLEEKVKEFRS